MKSNFNRRPVSVQLDPAVLCDWMERGWYQPSYQVADHPWQFTWVRVSAVVDQGDGTVHIEMTATAPEDRS